MDIPHQNFTKKTDTVPISVDTTKYVDALRLSNHQFSSSLYMEIAKKENGNICYSPFSVHVITFMASAGAASKTFDEIIAALHLNKANHTLEAYKILLEQLMNQNDNLKLATGMFIDNTLKVKDSFAENCIQYFMSSIEKLDFKNNPKEQCQYINNWVLNKTNEKIKGIFSEDSIDSTTSLIMANALHFKCSWSSPFLETSEEFFNVTSNTKITAKMMKKNAQLKYYHDDILKFSALLLDYLNGFTMIILLPDDKDGLQNLENNLSKLNLHEISNNLTVHQVSVLLPTFNIEQSLELENILTSLGCSTMFTQKADFSNIVENQKLVVSKFVHKTYVAVDENGTEATAATGFGLSLRKRLQEVNFIADHPFIFSIMSRTNDVLFMGRLVHP